MSFFYLSFIAVIIFVFNVKSETCEEYFDKNIKSVELLVNNKPNTFPPIININSDYLMLRFDELESSDVKNFYYTFKHCTHDWKKSKTTQNIFLNGFYQNFIEKYDFSVTTGVKYILYSLTFPNENISFKEPGNYLIEVYEQSSDKKILAKKFYVLDKKTTINPLIRTIDQGIGSEFYQNITFLVSVDETLKLNYRRDIVSIIRQNGRYDNSKIIKEPDFVSGNSVRYDNNLQNTQFEGGIEFLQLDLTDRNFATSSGKTINNSSIPNIILNPTYIINNLEYSFFNDINGNKILANKINSPINTLPYINVKFTLIPKKEYLTGNLYIIGDVVNWKTDSSAMLKYNPKTQNYEKNLLLKQGYYNYLYGFKKDGTNYINIGAVMGSSYQTENDYYIFTYHKSIFPKIDRLIGFKKINSIKNRWEIYFFLY